MIRALRQSTRNRVEQWAHKRHGTQTSPQSLKSKRIYIVPSKSGAVFALLIFVMLVGAMNYNNSMGLGLTFLLGSFMLVSMHHCHRNLLSLKVNFAHPEAVFCGQDSRIVITLHNPKAIHRFDLRVRLPDDVTQAFNLGPEQSHTISLPVTTTRRGLYNVPQLKISCRYPGGLFCAWTWVYWDLKQWVYPRPRGKLNLPTPRAGHEKGNTGFSRGDDEFAELRDFRRGDSLNKVAWKQVARKDELISKEFENLGNADLQFNIRELSHLSLEARLEQLTKWVLEAHGQNLAFALDLGSQQISRGSGKRHLDRCLKTLAAYQ